MLQGIFTFNHGNLIVIYWTLSYELLFYVVMAVMLIIGWIKHIERIALIWLGAMFILRVTMIFGHGSWLYWTLPFRLFLMPQFGHLFIAGMMIYRTRSNG
jgi:peptidoglycan/LPS O-acetylase OafA/YrhL